MSATDSPRRELHFVAAQDHRVGAELVDADVEGDPGAGRGALEDERDAAPGEATRRRAARPRARGSWPAFRSAARSSSRSSSKAPSSSPVRKSRFKAPILRRWRSPSSAGTSSTAATSRPTPTCARWRSRLLRLDERNDTHVQVNRDLTAGVRDAARLGGLGRGDAAGVPAALRRRRSARASGAEYHRVFTSRNELGFWRACAGAAEPGPDRERRGRLEHDPGAGAGQARRDRRAARAGDPRGRAGAPVDGLHPDRLRPLHRQPARDQRPAARWRSRTCCAAPRRRASGPGRAADLRRRPQPAPGREPGDLRAPRRRVRPRLAGRPGASRSTTSSSAASRSSRRRPSGRRSGASCPSTARPCASPITPGRGALRQRGPAGPRKLRYSTHG